ncbi:uncharacterized protein LOC111404680 [Olea europaea var. sylvestris]|uniref:uncharacterized protein LOC111404680 n=1 Tax=Olea europaea var. sylvestris TaxID=158386 RepID=UPI000C1D1FC2|nr:uncharacterized protein LOC111404680 [Olea europaea var. sylvestris]
MGVLETKLVDQKFMRILRNKFDGFMHVNNFCTHKVGRILILWNPSKIFLDVMEVHPQIIHCKATCKITSYTFLVNFVYGFHTLVNRRSLWNNIMEFNAQVSLPWMILGDYNNVLKFDENCNGADVTPYKIKDFENCCLHVGLTDVRSIGCYYTWTNNSVWTKIDRAMVNDIWVQNGACVDANFLPSKCLSDHSPCIVSIHDRVGGTKKPFKFFNMWTKHENLRDLIQTCWNFNVLETKQFILCKKLSKLKGVLKELNIKHFGHMSTMANKAKNELKVAQLQLHNQPMNENFQHMVAKLRKIAVVKRNSMRNFIATILKEDETYTTSQDQVATEFVKFYNTLLGKNCPTWPIDMEFVTNDPLVSLEQDDKSPGPDDYTSWFFKNAWGTIGDDFVGAIMEFFSSGSILKQINHAILALVPKFGHTPHVGDFRSISCCNVTYKAIAKILTSILRPILGNIVDHAQAVFVEGRSMMENVHLAQELMRQYNKKMVAPRCLLRIDLTKSYDSVSWDFLRDVLEGFHFPSRFVSWDMECVTSPTYFVALNGSMHGFFKGRKGLRQGDLLSPFLFVLCIEYFSRMFRATTNDSDFNYHPKCDPLKITYLGFADDLMLFARGDVMSVKILMDCLSNFGLVLGLRLNILKSNLYTVGIYGQPLEDILQLTNIPKGSMSFRYLGISLASRKLKVSCYAPFLEKITTYIGAWNCSSLSYAGKVELIRAGSKKPLVVWNDLCLPKDEGGLSLKDLKSWNLALLAKTLWNINHKKDTLWIRWVHQVYLKGACIWEVHHRKDHSPLFKKLLEIRNILLHKLAVAQEMGRHLDRFLDLPNAQSRG